MAVGLGWETVGHASGSAVRNPGTAALLSLLRRVDEVLTGLTGSGAVLTCIVGEFKGKSAQTGPQRLRLQVSGFLEFFGGSGRKREMLLSKDHHTDKEGLLRTNETRSTGRLDRLCSGRRCGT